MTSGREQDPPAKRHKGGDAAGASAQETDKLVSHHTNQMWSILTGKISLKPATKAKAHSLAARFATSTSTKDASGARAFPSIVKTYSTMMPRRTKVVPILDASHVDWDIILERGYTWKQLIEVTKKYGRIVFEEIHITQTPDNQVFPENTGSEVRMQNIVISIMECKNEKRCMASEHLKMNASRALCRFLYVLHGRTATTAWANALVSPRLFLEMTGSGEASAGGEDPHNRHRNFHHEMKPMDIIKFECMTIDAPALKVAVQASTEVVFEEVQLLANDRGEFKNLVSADPHFRPIVEAVSISKLSTRSFTDLEAFLPWVSSIKHLCYMEVDALPFPLLTADLFGRMVKAISKQKSINKVNFNLSTVRQTFYKHFIALVKCPHLHDVTVNTYDPRTWSPEYAKNKEALGQQLITAIEDNKALTNVDSEDLASGMPHDTWNDYVFPMLRGRLLERTVGRSREIFTQQRNERDNSALVKHMIAMCGDWQTWCRSDTIFELLQILALIER